MPPDEVTLSTLIQVRCRRLYVSQLSGLQHGTTIILVAKRGSALLGYGSNLQQTLPNKFLKPKNFKATVVSYQMSQFVRIGEIVEEKNYFSRVKHERIKDVQPFHNLTRRIRKKD
ncbi:hypothetical protein RUM43_010647 [Polyplax serrata]|uniref:Uncharacterized protein n=1 Tax=Polyplax serrata TaxID=468196 RepID=A0AAN8PAK9_POLSC